MTARETNRPILPAPIRMRRFYSDDTEADGGREGAVSNACQDLGSIYKNY